MTSLSFARTAFAKTIAVATFAVAASSAQASFSNASAIFTGVLEVRSTGTAAVSFIGPDYFEAGGFVSGGVADPFIDGGFFYSELSAQGEATAVNGFGGPEYFYSESYADSEGINTSSAYTFIDTELEFTGYGSVEIDLGYDLFVETLLGSSASESAYADIYAFTSELDTVSESVEVFGSATGDTLASLGVLTLSFSVDDFGLGAYSDFLTVATTATATTVPVPAAAWFMMSGLIGLISARRMR